eukprot:FR741223.1.p1 GENE.FR741223.1~~FR741223.1.p1  ORF type:complete len:167 (+),score=15.42 FR741223.1:67-501(+)
MHQLVMLVPLTALTYRLQGQEEEPLMTSVRDGISCLVSGVSPEDGKYIGNAYCTLGPAFFFVYVGSTMLVNVVVDGVLLHGTERSLYRAVTAATLSAFVVLGLLADGESNLTLGLPSAIALLIGNEMYHRYSEPGAEIYTTWAL